MGTDSTNKSRKPSKQKKPSTSTLSSSEIVEQIKGDGHCLFRSIGYGLVDLYEQDKTSFLDSLRTQQRKSNPVLAQKIGELIALIPGARINEENSKKLIFLLRDIACTYNEEIKLFQSGGKEYFKKMRRDDWGTSAEIQALSDALGVKVKVKTGEGNLNIGKAGPEITIQYTGNHFNLIKKVNSIYKRTFWTQ